MIITSNEVLVSLMLPMMGVLVLLKEVVVILTTYVAGDSEDEDVDHFLIKVVKCRRSL